MIDQPRLPYGLTFWTAVALTVVLWFIPFGSLIIWPFTFLATWAHEMGHGIAGILVGGTFDRLEIYEYGGGRAFITGVPGGGIKSALISVGGLVGAPLLGAMFVALGVREMAGRVLLFLLAVTLLLSAVFLVRTVFGVAVSVIFAAVLGFCAYNLGPQIRFLLVQLVGIQMSLSAVRGFDYLFSAYANFPTGRVNSDVTSIAESIGGHYLLWGGLIFVFNALVLLGAFRVALHNLTGSGSEPELNE